LNRSWNTDMTHETCAFTWRDCEMFRYRIVVCARTAGNCIYNSMAQNRHTGPGDLAGTVCLGSATHGWGEQAAHAVRTFGRALPLPSPLRVGMPLFVCNLTRYFAQPSCRRAATARCENEHRRPLTALLNGVKRTATAWAQSHHSPTIASTRPQRPSCRREGRASA